MDKGDMGYSPEEEEEEGTAVDNRDTEGEGDNGLEGNRKGEGREKQDIGEVEEEDRREGDRSNPREGNSSEVEGMAANMAERSGMIPEAPPPDEGRRQAGKV